MISHTYTYVYIHIYIYMYMCVFASVAVWAKPTSIFAG